MHTRRQLAIRRARTKRRIMNKALLHEMEMSGGTYTPSQLMKDIMQGQDSINKELYKNTKPDAARHIYQEWGY